MNQQWRYLMSSANAAYIDGAYDDSLRINHLALLLSKQEFTQQFLSSNSELAINTTLNCYFKLIDTYVVMENFISASIIFDEITDFLSQKNQQLRQTHMQRKAMLNGAVELQQKWTIFAANYPGQLHNMGALWINNLPKKIRKLRKNSENWQG